MTSLEFLGHAGLAVRSGNTLLLCDPWMSPAGGYNASWFQYPEYPSTDLSALLEPTAVYISHEHLDHFDPEFLERLDKTTPIVTGRFHKKRLLVKLKKLGFEHIVELDDFEGFEVSGDMKLRISTAAYNCPPHWFDSCCIIETQDCKAFNLNDCNLALPLEMLRAEHFDVMFAQASPAIWYPLTYPQYSDEERRELIAARRESALTSFVTAAKAMQPSLAVPCAGPPCFFDDELYDIFTAPGSMFPTPTVALRTLADQTDIAGEMLKPGDKLIWEKGERQVSRHPAYEDFDYERDRLKYCESKRPEKRRLVEEVKAAIPVPTPGLFDRFKAHLEPLISRNPYFSAHIDMRVLFDVTGPEGGRWIADFRDPPPSELVYPHEGEEYHYSFEVESRYLDQVLSGEMSWEDMFLSLRFKARRDPDVYNQHLFTFFKMGDHAALQKIAKAEIALSSGPTPTFTLEADGVQYEVQRFCPHAGSDLSQAPVEGGYLICPGHDWRFSLEDGTCQHAGYTIQCRRKET